MTWEVSTETDFQLPLAAPRLSVVVYVDVSLFVGPGGYGYFRPRRSPVLPVRPRITQPIAEINAPRSAQGVSRAARDAEATAEELLVDEGWKMHEVESEVNGTNGYGHHDPIGIGPSVKLVLGNGHHACQGRRERPVEKG